MLTRRMTLQLMAAGSLAPAKAFAAEPVELMWEDLIPPGIPYSEIIGEGDIDYLNDTWNPIYDANGVKLNEALDGQYIKMPGFVVPLDFSEDGTREFLFVPYVGACVHVPPPPANQLIYATSEEPWLSEHPWDAIWVTGTLQTQIQDTDLGQSGYVIEVDNIELYVW